MATRAAIAAADRKSREKIAEKDRVAREKIEKRRDDTTLGVGAANAAASLGRGVAGWFNHPEWYKKFVSQEYRAALPTFTRLGNVLVSGWLDRNGTGTGIISTTRDQVAGICVISYLPSLPNQVSGNTYYKSPVNVGLSRFMSQLRKFNSRVGEYDPSDFGLYWYSAADFMYWIETLRFVVKTYNTYHATNAYLAKVLIEAKGFDFDDVAAHIAEYKALCQVNIEIFNTNIVIPKNLTFILRRFWMANAIIADHNSKKCQMYTFRQEATGYLNASENEYTVSTYLSSANSKLTFTTVEGRIDTVRRSLVDAQGIQVMIQDLRAAMKEDMFFKLPEFDGKAQLEINYSDQDLEQIHNIMTLPGRMNYDTHPMVNETYGGLSIHAMTDGYLYQGTLGSGGVPSNSGPYQSNLQFNDASIAQSEIDAALTKAYNESAFLNFYHDDVGEDSILEATRLRVADIDTGTADVYPTTRGTEVPICFVIYNLDESVTDGYRRILHYSFNTSISNCQGNVWSQLKYYAIASRFDWMPCIKYCHPYVSGSTHYLYYATMGEIDNYFSCVEANLRLIHEAATLSEFYLEDKDFTGGKFVAR